MRERGRFRAFINLAPNPTLRHNASMQPVSTAELLRISRRAGAALLDLVYPPACLVCRKAVAQQGALCPDCWREIAFIERPYCERLGAPFERDLDQPGLISPEAAANPPVFRRARAVARYDSDKARALAHRLKYYDRLELAEPMGRWMARAGAEILAEADILAPIPLHRLRLAARRFNQSAALARIVSRETGVPLETMALMRVKATTPQVGLSRAQRAANLSGAFHADSERAAALVGRNVVLVDDVLTTGATANAAARALLKAGAAQVDLLVFARAVTTG
jgi:ComF family protein